MCRLGSRRPEIHKPVLEDRLRHRIQCLVHATVQFDLVVQCVENVGNGFLFMHVR